MGEPGEQPEWLGERRHAGMRNGDAAADSGRTETLALEQAVEQATLIELEKSGVTTGQLCQQGFLPGRLQVRQNGVGAGQQIADFHNDTNRLTGANQPRSAEGCDPIGASPGPVK